MQLIQLYESAQLKSYKNWKRPSAQTLKENFSEYKKHESAKWEIRARNILLQFPVFTDEADFREKVDAGEIQEVDKSFAQKVNGMSAASSISSLKSLVNTYSEPRDVQKIVNGFKSDDKMPMPIILRGSKGMQILAGNTRCNVAFALGLKPKVIIIDLSVKETE